LLPTFDSSLKLPEINGLSINYKEYKKVGSLESESYILLKCTFNQYFDYYIQILKEILGLYDNSDLSLSECITTVITRWRHFLSLPKLGVLDVAGIIGLLGELIYLDLVVESGNPSFINFWTADSGEEDFIFGDTIVEVKTTEKASHSHYINGIDQLSVMTGQKKYILSVLLTDHGNGELYALPSIINKITHGLKGDPMLLDLFYQKIKSRGYDIRDHAHYESYQFFINKVGVFDVGDDFPKLTSNQLSRPLSSRISKVSYLLDLEGLSVIDSGTHNYKKQIFEWHTSII
jgi:hypothetical protein